MLGRIQEQEGRTYMSISKKESGDKDYRETRSLNEPNGSTAMQKVTSAQELRFCQGRTVNLGNYESARISVSYSAHGDVLVDEARAIVSEVLSREIANLSNKSRDNNPLVDTVGEGAVIGIDYGLTLNLGNFESAKIDIGITTPIADDENIEASIRRITAECEQRIKQEVGTIRGLKSGADLGF